MQNFSPICVDANLVVRLITLPDNEPIQQLWFEWREDGRRLVAPNLLRYEVTNAFHRIGLTNPAERPGLRRGMDAVMALPIELHHDDWLHTEALELAGRFHLNATYDAHYLALARRLGCELWTADRRLANAVAASLPWVRLVAS